MPRDNIKIPTNGRDAKGLTGRQKSVLFSLIEEYVKTKIPVSSKLLAKRNYFDLSSATIRSEMKELENSGFLEKPHTSAGRVPSDAGYRLFVNEFFSEQSASAPEQSPLNFRKNVFSPSEAVKTLAKRTKNLALFHDAALHDFFQSGFSELFANPEFENSENILRFGKFFEKLEDEFDELFSEIESDFPRVFIGRELPLKEAESFSLIISRCEFGGERKGIFALLGPKRMDYRRNWLALNDLMGRLNDTALG